MMGQRAQVVSDTVGAVRGAAAVLFVLAVLIGGQSVVNAIEDASWWAGGARACYSLSLLLATVILAAVAERVRAARAGPSARLGMAGALLVCCACLAPLSSQQQIVRARFDSPRLNDIPLTTMAAGKVILAGRNPYTSPVDPRAESTEQQRSYDGFKYMPLMAVVYLPAAATDSQSAVIVINALLNILTAALVFLLARSLSGDVAGALAVIFYLSLRIVPRQLYGVGVTDLAAVVPVLAAFWVGDRAPLLGGLLAGISVSTKMLPALALVPVLAPAVNPATDTAGRRFWLGLLLGCVPSLLYFAWSPAALLSNVVFFNLFRPVDSTSWLDGHPAAWRSTATAVLLLLLVVGSVVRWVVRPAGRGRAVLVLTLIVAMTLLGPVNHGNYQLWWLPWSAVVFGFSLAVYVEPRRCEPRPAAPSADEDRDNSGEEQFN